MGEEGTHDSESGRFGEGERVNARDVDATAVTTVVAARANALEIVAVVTSVTRDGNAALGALVTASSGACTDTTLVTGAVTGMEGEREGAEAAAAARRVHSRPALAHPKRLLWVQTARIRARAESRRSPAQSQARRLT